jgi:hypothetical protein
MRLAWKSGKSKAATEKEWRDEWESQEKKPDQPKGNDWSSLAGHAWDGNAVFA